MDPNGVDEHRADGRGQVEEEIPPHTLLGALLGILLLLIRIDADKTPYNFHFCKTDSHFGSAVVVIFFLA